MFRGHAHGRAGDVHFREPQIAVTENLCFDGQADVANFLFMGDAAECSVVLYVQLKTDFLWCNMGLVIVFAISWLEEEFKCVASFPSVVIVVSCVIVDDGIAHGGIGFEMAVCEREHGGGWFGGSCSIQIVDEGKRCSENVFSGRRDGRLREGLDEFVEWHRGRFDR